VYWLKRVGPGTMWVPARPTTRAVLAKAAAELGFDIEGAEGRPAGEALELRPVRIGLWDQYGGSMTSGWIRWVFEQFEFPYEVVYPAAIDAGNLGSRFDVLVLPDGAMPRAEGTGRGGRAIAQPKAEDIPEEYRERLGRLTPEKSVPQLKKFVEAGGTIVSVGEERGLSREKFYVPGSVLRVSVDNTNPIGYGLPKEVDVFFENSPVFRLPPDAEAKGLKPVAWFPNATPLRSGWAWGQGYLEGTIAAAEASLGEGKLFLLGVEAAFRGQPHGTFKLLFNSVYAGQAKTVSP
jgi:hypothetical protein